MWRKSRETNFGHSGNLVYQTLVRWPKVGMAFGAWEIAWNKCWWVFSMWGNIFSKIRCFRPCYILTKFCPILGLKVVLGVRSKFSKSLRLTLGTLLQSFRVGYIRPESKFWHRMQSLASAVLLILCLNCQRRLITGTKHISISSLLIFHNRHLC